MGKAATILFALFLIGASATAMVLNKDLTVGPLMVMAHAVLFAGYYDRQNYGLRIIMILGTIVSIVLAEFVRSEPVMMTMIYIIATVFLVGHPLVSREEELKDN